MYFGEPYVIDLEDCKGCITIYQPTIGDIVRMGENKFYTSLSILVTNTTAYRSLLWEMGLDWNIVSDFILFTILYKGIDPDVSALLFHDLNIADFELMKNEDTGSLCLYNTEKDVEINEAVYLHISQYLRQVFNIFPEEKLTNDNTLKEWYIKKDQRQADIDKKKKDTKTNSILSVISGCLNHPGFKYKLSELKEIGVCQFYDSVKRLQIYEQTNAILHGMYIGLGLGGADKLKPDDYNFMRD